MVNKAVVVTVGGGVSSDAIRVLRAVDELDVVLNPQLAPDGGALVGHKNAVPVALLHRTRVNSATAHQIVHDTAEGTPTLVTATEMTARARDLLAGAGVGTVDAQGNVCLGLPGLVMRVATNRKPARRPRPTRLRGQAGVVAQALLLEPGRDWHVIHLAEVCGVSPALVSRVLARLDREQVLESRGAGPHKTRRVTNRTALLDLWDEEQAPPETSQWAFMLAQTSAGLIAQLADGLAAGGVEHALTGAAAAADVAPFLSNTLVAQVWIAHGADPVTVCTQISARPVDSGPNVVLLQERGDAPLAFREARSGGGYRANVLRVYADLAHDSRRGTEQRDHLRSQAIGY